MTILLRKPLARSTLSRHERVKPLDQCQLRGSYGQQGAEVDLRYFCSFKWMPAYPARHESARHHKRCYGSRVSLSALRTIGIEASASRTRRSRGGMPGTTSASDAASIPCRVAAHTWTA
jgi:hypothetical protein